MCRALRLKHRGALFAIPNPTPSGLARAGSGDEAVSHSPFKLVEPAPRGVGYCLHPILSDFGVRIRLRVTDLRTIVPFLPKNAMVSGGLEILVNGNCSAIYAAHSCAT